MSAYHVLNTDASRPDPSGEAAIGVVLRQKASSGPPRLVVVDYISKRIGPVQIQEAEYRALIEGLKLARDHNRTNLHVYSDSSSVVGQVNANKPKVKASVNPLWKEAKALIEEFEQRIKIKISWVPREMNAEADQRAADAFLR
jgi:ribonuclease HI